MFTLGSDLYLQNRGLNPRFRTLYAMLEGDVIVQILYRNNQRKGVFEIMKQKVLKSYWQDEYDMI